MAWFEATLRLRAPPKPDARGESVDPGDPVAAAVLSGTAHAGRRTTHTDTWQHPILAVDLGGSTHRLWSGSVLKE